jgi:hypothetical protein
VPTCEATAENICLSFAAIRIVIAALNWTSAGLPDNVTFGDLQPWTLSALVRALLTDQAAPVRKQSAVSLTRVVTKLNDSPTTEAMAGALVVALRDNTPTVRAAAADGLGRIGPEPKAVVPALLQTAVDQDVWVCGSSVVA